MKTKFLLYFLFLLPLSTVMYSCDMDKSVEVELPAHTPQLVVEGYLEAGRPYRVAVQESAGYFDAPTPPLVPDAIVYITHSGRRTQLEYKPKQDERTGFIYTHSSPEIMDGKPGDIYGLEVTDSRGRKITAYTTILPVVPIDTVEWRFNDKEKALLLTSFHDDPGTSNYYRHVTHRDSLTSGSSRDFTSSDDITNGKRVTFGSGYNYEPGDTLIISLFHIEKQYYDFLQSTENAKEANGNPFVQPSRIKSSVQGGIGIFTNLAYDRKTVIIE